MSVTTSRLLQSLLYLWTQVSALGKSRWRHQKVPSCWQRWHALRRRIRLLSTTRRNIKDSSTSAGALLFSPILTTRWRMIGVVSSMIPTSVDWTVVWIWCSRAAWILGPYRPLRYAVRAPRRAVFWYMFWWPGSVVVCIIALPLYDILCLRSCTNMADKFCQLRTLVPV